ncbi:hypothetical protein C8R44DRAFT_731410 [Mycena epipterygia]|nr:hypothetical protein C8R44DRAFT_731410 [Mycena epipterygia]
MPHQPTVTDIHVNSVIACLTPTVALLDEVTHLFGTPFFTAISSTTLTVVQIHTFIETQGDGNKIKYFFRRNEMNTLRKDCQVGLEEAVKVFEVEIGLTVAKMQEKAQMMHKELLRNFLIS